MPRDALIRNLAEHELTDLRTLRRRIVITAVCVSVFAACILGALVTWWATSKVNHDSIARGEFNCRIQRVGRIEGHKRFLHEEATQLVLNDFPALVARLRAEHPDIFNAKTPSGLPDLTDLPVPDCSKLPGAAGR